MNLSRFLPSALCGCLLLAAGCGRKTPPAAMAIGHPLISPRIAKCTPGVPGGRLTLVTSSPLQTFNPVLAASDEVTRLIFASLVNVDPAAKTLEPALAESWTRDPDGKSWTFKLRAGVYWSDGQPFTAEDVVFTWNEMMYHPKLDPSMYDIFTINGKKFSVSKVDDLTVKVVTPEAYAPLPELFGLVPILPAHILSQALRAGPFSTVYSLGTPPAQIVGCGPFRVAQVQGGIVLLERNPEYWAMDKKGQRLPYFNEVVFAFVPPGIPAKVFLEGKGDLYERGRPDEFPLFQQALTNAQFRLLDLGAGSERDVLWFNQNTGTNKTGEPLVPPGLLHWFRQEKFRQAVSCALDRERMAREVYQNRALSVYGLVSADNVKWANTNVPVFAHDLARARALLAEIGLQDRNGDGFVEDAEGKTVEFAIESNADNLLRAQCVRIAVENLQKAGLKATVKLGAFAPLLQRLGSGEYQCILLGLGGTPEDPASLANVLKSDQPQHQWFPNQKTPSTPWEARVDTLMDAQLRAQDFAERKKLFDEVQAILAEQLPMICTVAPTHFVAVRTDLTNLRPNLGTPYRATWNLEELFFSPNAAPAPR